jgi:hypothetical protein
MRRGVVAGSGLFRYAQWSWKNRHTNFEGYLLKMDRQLWIDSSVPDLSTIAAANLEISEEDDQARFKWSARGRCEPRLR